MRDWWASGDVRRGPNLKITFIRADFNSFHKLCVPQVVL